MKKLIGLLALTLVFTCCNIGVQPSSAGTGSSFKMDRGSSSGAIVVDQRYVDGMRYDVYHGWKAVHVVNVTKDKLEVELMQAQLDSLKNN